MKKMLESIRTYRELIITNVALIALLIILAGIAISGHTIISGIVAIAAFIAALVLFFLAPYGEQTIAVCTAMCNAFAFGIGMLYSPDRTYIAYITIGIVIVGFVFESMLTVNRAEGRI